MKSIVVFVPKGLSAGVVQSQIIDYVYAASGRFKILVLFQQFSDFHSFCVSDNLQINTNIVIENYDSVKLLKILRDFDFIYLRDVVTFLKLLPILFFFRIIFNIKLIYDFRALVSYESFYRNRSKVRYGMLKTLEWVVTKRADFINCVNCQIRDSLQMEYGVKKLINVVPCCVSKNRLKNSFSKDKINFVYVGSLAPWQLFLPTLDLFIELRRVFSENITLTVLTHDLVAAREIIDSYHLCDVTIDKFNFNSDWERLSNFDFGFLLREDSVVNKYASPIKFAEYLAVGIIPITTKFIGDISLMPEFNSIAIDVGNPLCPDITRLVNRIYQFLEDKEIHTRLFNLSHDFLWKSYEDNLFVTE